MTIEHLLGAMIIIWTHLNADYMMLIVMLLLQLMNYNSKKWYITKGEYEQPHGVGEQLLYRLDSRANDANERK
jgi:hypothetical protein